MIDNCLLKTKYIITFTSKTHAKELKNQNKAESPHIHTDQDITVAVCCIVKGQTAAPLNCGFLNVKLSVPEQEVAKHDSLCFHMKTL